MVTQDFVLRGGRDCLLLLMALVAVSLTLIPTPSRSQPVERTKATVITSPTAIDPRINEATKVSYLRPKYACPIDSDPIAKRVFAEYGSILVAERIVTLPGQCIYKDEAEIFSFQGRLKTSVAKIAGVDIELQEPAMKALLNAEAEITRAGRMITPLDGSIAGRRNFYDTLRLWNSRFSPAVAYWVRLGRIGGDEGERIRAAALDEQVRQVMQWESEGIYFSTNFTNSIFTSVAPPGTSQHLFLLAFDVVEYNDPVVVSSLNSNGWYQTVVDDPLHFTYLGLPESELPKRGLKLVYRGRHGYWVPNLAPSN